MSETAAVVVPVNLPPGQARVYAAICRVWAEDGRPPTARDLCRLCGIGSPNGVLCHLAPLAKKGVIEWDRANKARGIWPVGLREKIRAALAGPTDGEG